MCGMSHRGMELAIPAAYGTTIRRRGRRSAIVAGRCTVANVAQTRSADSHRRRHRAAVCDVLDLLALDLDDKHVAESHSPVRRSARGGNVGLSEHVHVRDADLAPHEP